MIIDIFNITNKYDIIYADPAWTYNDKANAGKRGACYKYDLMTHEDICNLPIQNISSENCILFIWVTMPMLAEGLQTIKSWGFKYKTCGFTWIKQNKISDTLFMGMGNWTRSNPELCLIATKGKPKRIDAGIHSVIISHLEGHSKKPDETRERIVKLCGDLPRIELFARQETVGWDCFGNEI